jgi:hypothetical protein
VSSISDVNFGSSILFNCFTDSHGLSRWLFYTRTLSLVMFEVADVLNVCLIILAQMGKERNR